MPDSLAHRLVDLGDVRLHVVEAGPEDGPLAVLLHGFPEFWYGWRHQIPLLAAAGFRVVAPDQRGYARSSKPRGLSAYRVDRLADDVAGLIAAYGRREAAVAGHDWGGIVAWWSAVRHPHRVTRLAVANVPHPVVMRRFLLADRRQLRRSWYVFFFQLPGLPERRFSADRFRVGLAALTSSAPPGTFSQAELARYRQAWSHPGAVRGMIAWYRAALRRPLVATRGQTRVRQPTVLLWGERDRFLGREMIEPSLALCDDGRAVCFPEAGHFVQHERPEEVGGELVRHFSS